MMKMKSLVLAVSLAISAAGAYAEDINTTITLTEGPPNTYSAGFDITHVVAGLFTDTISFEPTVSGLTNGSLVTIATNDVTNVDFTSANINGLAFTFASVGNGEVGFTIPGMLTGPLVMTVMGSAGANASYGGTINVSAVPEPETWAMMLGGLGLVGFMARRRKKAEAAVPELAAC
jgi:hypothetical protein